MAKETGKIIKDWFGRRAEDSFTKKDNKNKLFNWDKNREGGLSSYFTDDSSTMQDAATMTASMFNVLDITKHQKYAKDPGQVNNVSKITIPLGMLKDEEGNWDELDTKKLDAFYGAAIQNASIHALQSSKDREDMMFDRARSKRGVKHMFSDILNTERLDNNLAEKYPGYLKFVQKFKDHTFEETYEAPGEDAKPQEKLMDLMNRLIRYPANVTEEELDEFQEPVRKMERLIKKHDGIPENKSGCDAMASSLANIVYKYIPEEEEEEPEQNGPGGNEDGEGDDESGGGGTPSPTMSKEELDSLAGKMEKSMTGEAENMTNVSRSDVEDFEDSMEEEENPSASNQYIDYDEDGEVIDNYPVKFIKSDTDKSNYSSIRDSIDFTKAHVLRTLFERKARDYAFAMKGMRNGRLDPCKIAEAVQGVQTVYERMAQVTTNKVLVGVLVDESGSMDGQRISKAREAAIFINEIFRKMNDVELFIYGHTADQGGGSSTNIRVYKERGFQNDVYALGSISARSMNRDGHAILATARRIRQFNKNQGVLFVMSDGQPSANGYSGNFAIEDTRKKVLQAEKLGFQIIQIAIASGVRSKDMFDKYIEMTNIAELPRSLSVYMSTKVDKMITETVTM